MHTAIWTTDQAYARSGKYSATDKVLSGIRPSLWCPLHTCTFHTDIAEWVLNKCALSKPIPSNSSHNRTNEVSVDIEQNSDVEETDIRADCQPQSSVEGTTQYTYRNADHDISIVRFSASIDILSPGPHTCGIGWNRSCGLYSISSFICTYMWCHSTQYLPLYNHFVTRRNSLCRKDCTKRNRLHHGEQV